MQQVAGDTLATSLGIIFHAENRLRGGCEDAFASCRKSDTALKKAMSHTKTEYGDPREASVGADFAAPGVQVGATTKSIRF